jgi:hypothetical protein
LTGAELGGKLPAVRPLTPPPTEPRRSGAAVGLLVLGVLVGLAALGLVVVGCASRGATELATEPRIGGSSVAPVATVPSSSSTGAIGSTGSTGPAAATRLVSDAGRIAVVAPPRGFRPQGTPLVRQTIAGATMITQAFASARDPHDVAFTGPRFSITATITPNGTDQPAHLADMHRTFGATDLAGLRGDRHPITYAQLNCTPVLEWIESPTVTVTVSGIDGTTVPQLLDAANAMAAQ